MSVGSREHAGDLLVQYLRTLYQHAGLPWDKHDDREVRVIVDYIADAAREEAAAALRSRQLPARLAQDEPGAEVLHWVLMDGPDGGEFACRPQGDATATTDVADVTCPACKATPEYLDELDLKAAARA